VKVVLDRVVVRHAGASRSALDDVSLAFEAGERVAIVGPSGAGKTTLLAVASLQLEPRSGRVLVDDVDPWTLSSGERHRLRPRLFVAPQTPPLPPRQRVVTAVLAARLPGRSLASTLASWIHPRDAALAAEALAPLGLADKLWSRVDRLSGGERQRVALARLFASTSRAWFVDEPLSALDPVLAERTIALLVDAATTRAASLIASLHQIELALAHFPRTVGLAAGRVAFDRPSEEVDTALRDALYATSIETSREPDRVEGAWTPELADAALAAPRG
jgi:phosphonate transport system ATP-binding protein